MKLKKTAEELRKLLELRRSNAATPVKNKKQYSRKIKFKKYKILWKNQDSINAIFYVKKEH